MDESVNYLTVLKKKCKNFWRIQLQLTRAQMLKSTAQPSISNWGVNGDFQLVEELLLLVHMQEKVLMKFLLNWKHFLAILSFFVKKMVEFVSDGAPAMDGKN